ncbi:MAG: molybdopterin-dependent oxidoreductase [Deltaproteobacteria bacterium]|nr:molybdopterin-dependent oxidoreductase [Deltaproteobacteria bacterium]
MSDVKWIKTRCARFDHGGCGIKVLVDRGKAVCVSSDIDYSRSSGYICSKGAASLERIYHPDRLKTPLRRSGKRGGGSWDEISWDEALEYASCQLKHAKEGFGAETVAFMQGAPKGLEYMLLMRLANSFGISNVAARNDVCHWPRELMARVTCGFLPVPDYEMSTRCILLWGSNPFDTNEEGVLGVQVKRCLDAHNPALIVIDSYKTELARKADLWLQIKPGTDDLLALCFLHVIISKGLFDATFVEEWTTGFELLRDYVKPYTPGVVSRKTRVSEDKIIRAAELYAKSNPAVLHAGNAAENNGTNNTSTCRALVILMAITGNLDVPGGNIQAAFPPVLSPRNFIRLESAGDKKIQSISAYYGTSLRVPAVPGALLIKTILDEKPYPIKALLIQGSNPVISYAGSQSVFNALNKLDFLMVSDLFMTPTAALADLVLPAATNMEFNDIGQYGMVHGYIEARPKIIEPQGQCWSDIKIINELGKRLGLEECFWGDIDGCLDEILAPSGLNYKQFCEAGLLEGKKRYFKYREKGFPTPSGKVEIYSSIMEKGGYDPLPAADVKEKAADAFPLLLTSAKPKHFFHTAYRGIVSLRKKSKGPTIRINPQTAEKYSLSVGDSVEVASPWGKARFDAAITESIGPGVVMVDYGWWFPEAGEKEMFRWRDSNINMLTSGSPLFNSVLGTPQLRAIPCRIRKTGIIAG